MAGESRGSGRNESTDFIRAIVAEHQARGTYGGRVETRFPPEPNGYLHIGHTRAIVLNFGLAAENGGVCHLRFDDTNPLTEDMKYVRAIQEDIRWLGYEWGEHLYFASDYFEKLHEAALVLIRKGKAYVDSLSEEEIREYRGTVTEPGRDSPFRDRSVEENLDLFRRMKDGEFEEGAHVLRGKIDMAHPNMVMRDPIFYRIRHASHYRRGEAWCIYPLYDFTHCLSDAFEDITHSLCSLEFENNREIYDWILDEVGFQEPRTHQYEFGRMNLEYTVVSKRKLLRLVNEGHVDGWDDPRMPTIAGMRRRGVPPQAIRSFTESVGVAKVNNRVDLAKLEFAIRDHLNRSAPRVMAVLNPLKVVITNYPEGDSEELEAPYYPHDVPLEGSRMVPFSRELFIEADDFMEEPPKDFFRLAPGREVRLRYAYFIRCDEVVKDPATGQVVELCCTYDPETRGGDAPDGRKVRGTLHWVSAAHGVPVEARLYDRLFTAPDPDDVPEGEDFISVLNPDSSVVLEGARVEPSVRNDPPGTRYQFERLGYFMADPEDSRPGSLVFNRIVTLRDTWGRRAGAQSGRYEATRSDTDLGVRGGAMAETGPFDATGSNGRPEPTTAPPGRDTGREARDEARARDPSLAERFTHFQKVLALSEDQADILTGSQELARFFEAAVASHPNAPALANWAVNELLREVKDRPLVDLLMKPEDLGTLVALLDEGTVSQPVAKEIFAEMVEKGIDPRAAVEERGLEKLSDRDALGALVDEVLAGDPEKAQEYRAGKTGLMGFFTGRIMRATQGRADPQVVQELLRERLES
jgi:glutaminyl-tRNA synthetase